MISIEELQSCVRNGIDFVKKQKDVINVETVANTFFHEFVEESGDLFVKKSLLRDAFSDYLKKRGLEGEGSSLIICDLLAERGHDVRAKKRCVGDKNPVAVIKGIGFDWTKFNNYMRSDKQILEHHDPDKFNVMINILQNSTIRTPMPKILK